MELIGPVHHRGVLVTLSPIEQPRKVGVQAFIVAHDARPKVVEPCNQREEHDPRKKRDLIRDGWQGGMDWFLKPGGIFVIHKTLIFRNLMGDLYFMFNVLTS